jgi:tetratricopeptide (TPR) repeat protein
VARHLVATGRLVDGDPELALEHAQAARQLAPRIAAIREAVGIAAYQAGEWSTAIAELRAYHRMTGRQNHLAVLADCERALGRPDKAIDIFRSVDQGQLDSAEAIELLVVASGARRDLGQDEAAVAMLQVRELTQDAPWSARLRYAYADALLGIGRAEEAREWFARAAETDEDASTDAAERLLELDGVQLDEDDQDEYDDIEDEEGAPAATGRRDLATDLDDEDRDGEDLDEEDLDDEDFDEDDEDEEDVELDDEDDEDLEEPFGEFDDDADEDDDFDDEHEDDESDDEDDDELADGESKGDESDGDDEEKSGEDFGTEPGPAKGVDAAEARAPVDTVKDGDVPGRQMAGDPPTRPGGGTGSADGPAR